MAADAIIKALADDGAEKAANIITRRAVRAGASVANQLGGQDLAQEGAFLRAVNVGDRLPEGSGLSAAALIPRSIDRDPELFYGPFLQLGTFLGIENPVLEEAVNFFLDPTSLILAGTGVLLNRAGRLSRLASGAIRSARAADLPLDSGQAAVSASRALDGIENALRVLGAGDDALDGLRAAAQGPRAGFKSYVDDLLAAAPESLPAETRDLLQVLRRSRQSLLDLDDIARRYKGEDLAESGFMLGRTLPERLKLGQVNPVLRLERPFAFTRATLLRNTSVGLEFGDTVMWTPVGAKFALGGRVGEAALSRLPSEQVTRRIAEEAGEEFVLDRASAAQAAANADTLTRLKIVEQQVLAASATPAAPLEPSFLGRNLSDEEVIEAWGRLGQGDLKSEDFAGIDEARQKLVSLAMEQDHAAYEEARAATRRAQAERLRMTRKVARESAPEGADPADYARAQAAAVKSIFTATSPRGILTDPAGPAIGVQQAIARLNLVDSVLAETVGETIDAAIPVSLKAPLKGRKMRRYYREAIAFPSEYPEAFERVDDVLRLKGDDELERVFKAGREAEAAEGRKGTGFDLLEDALSRAERDGIPLRRELQAKGFTGDMTSASDVLANVNQQTGRALKDRGLVEKSLENYWRRSIRRVKRGDRQAAEAVFDEILENGDTDLGKLLREHSKITSGDKARESVLRMRRATDRQLLALERKGIIEVERDAIRRFTNGQVSAQRALVAATFWEDVAFHTKPYSDDMIEFLSQGNTGLTRAVTKDFPRRADGTLDTSRFKAGFREIETVEPLSNRAPWTRHGMTQKEYEKLYKPLRLKFDLAREGPLGRVQIARFGDEAAKGVDSELAKDAARSAIIEDIKLKGRASRLFGSLKDANGKALDHEDLAEAINIVTRGGRLPRRFRQAGPTAKKIRAEYQKRLKGEAKALAEKVAKAGDGSLGYERTLWVLRGREGPLEEALGVFDKDATSSELWQRIDRFGSALKAIQLNLSPFHYNVLAFAKIISQPGDTARVLLSDSAKEFRRQAAVKAGLGAAGGAVAGGALGEDAESVFAGSIAGMIYGTGIGAALSGAKVAKRYALSPEYAETYARAGRALWSGRPDDRAIGVVARGMERLSASLRDKYGARNLASLTIDGAFEAQTAFERNMWEIAHNGFKMQAFHAWSKQIDDELLKEGLRAGTPEFIERQTIRDREVMQVVNSTFGGFSASRLFRDPNWQYRARRFLLAPDWTVGNVLGAGNILANMSIPQQAGLGAAVGAFAELADAGFDPEGLSGRGLLGGALVGPSIGALSRNSMNRMFAPGDTAARFSRRLYRNAILGGYFFSNLINYMNTGHFMWDNPEGKRLAVALPDGQTYLGLGKPYKETLEFASSIEPDKYPEIVLSRLRTKLAPIPRFAVEVVSNQSFFGPTVRASDGPVDALTNRVSHAVAQITPISVQGPIRAIRRLSTQPDAEFGDEAVRAALAALGQPVLTSRPQGPNLTGLAGLGLANTPDIASATTGSLERFLQ